jgi:hypothetical protein
MLRAAVVVFVAGWIAWFVTDKTGLVLPRGGGLLQDLQTGFDMLRAGFPRQAFVFTWYGHYLVLSLLSGLLLSVLRATIGEALGRRRLRNQMLPRHRPVGGPNAGESVHTASGGAAAPASRDGD